MNYGPMQQAAQYKAQQIQTATQEEILILLYEGAIRFLVIAKKAMQEKDIEKTHKYLIKAQDIITEFMTSLDMDIGGEVAKNLYALYEYFIFRLVQANIKKDTAMVDEVLEHLRELKKTWEQAIEITNQERKAQGTSRQAQSLIEETLTNGSTTERHYHA